MLNKKMLISVTRSAIKKLLLAVEAIVRPTIIAFNIMKSAWILHKKGKYAPSHKLYEHMPTHHAAQRKNVRTRHGEMSKCDPHRRNKRIQTFLIGPSPSLCDEAEIPVWIGRLLRDRNFSATSHTYAS